MNHEQRIERRLTVRLVAYWERVRGDRLMPSENDIDPDELADLWDYCFLVQVRDLAKSDYNYTYLGTAIVDAYRAGMPDDDSDANSDIVSLSANKLTTQYQRVMESRKPVLEEGEFGNLHGDIVKYRQCLLPLAHDGSNVDAIFGGMRFRIFPAAGLSPE